MNKRILLLVPDLKGSGGVTNLYNVLKLDEHIDLHYFPVNAPKKQSSIHTLYRLIKNYILFFIQLVKGNYNLVHVNPSLYPRSFYRDALFILIAKFFKIKVLITFHGWLENFEKKISNGYLKKYLFLKSFAKADGFIVLGKIFKDKLLQMGVPLNSQFFIETTVADSQLIDELNLGEKFESYNKEVVFLFLATLTKSKGIYIALDAFRKFTLENKDIASSFIVAGDGDARENVKKYIKDNLIKNVECVGHIANPYKNEILRRAHIMVLPSYSEGLPNTILEGMLYGMPIIASKTGAIPEIVQTGVNGFISEDQDSEVYANFMSNLTKEKIAFKGMMYKNHESAMNNYTIEKVRARVLSIYKTI